MIRHHTGDIVPYSFRTVRGFFNVPHQYCETGPTVYRPYPSMKLSDWEYFYSPLDGMLVHRRVTPSIKFAGTHLYTWVERGSVRVKCLAQEHDTMSPARVRTRSARSGVERANHEATALPTAAVNLSEQFIVSTQYDRKVFKLISFWQNTLI